MTTNTVQALCDKAYVDAGLNARGTVSSPTQALDGLDRLNDIISLYATQGLKVWLQQDISVPLTAGQTIYTLGPGGTVNMTKPLQVTAGYLLLTSGVKQPLVLLSKDEYTRLSQTGVNGAVNSFYPDKQLAQVAVSLYMPPDATAATATLHLICRVAPTLPVTTGDSIAFPPEWFIALRWALALDLATGQSQEIQMRCEKMAGTYKEALEGFDVEDAPTFFTPDTRTQYYTNGFR